MTRRTRHTHAHAWSCVVGLAIALGALLSTSSALADARSDYLVRLLRDSGQFRVRAQAAISLGNVRGEPDVIEALLAALADEHPAVRAAAATSLGDLGDSSHVASLRPLERDPEGPVQTAARLAIAKLSSATTATVQPSVPRGPPRFYVAVGRPGTTAARVTPAMLDRARGYITGQLSEMDGVVLAPEGEKPKDAEQELKRRALTGYYIEGSITSLEDKDGGTRAAVSLVVATYPGRDIRAMMSGAATVIGTGGTAEQAVEGALRSALRKLPQAMGQAR